MKELILFNLRRHFLNRIAIIANILLFMISLLIVNSDLITGNNEQMIVYLDKSLESYHQDFEAIEHDEYCYLLNYENKEGPLLCYEGDFILKCDYQLNDETLKMIEKDITKVMVKRDSPGVEKNLEICLTMKYSSIPVKTISWIILSLAFFLISVLSSSIGGSVLYEKNAHILETILTNTDVRSHLLSKLITGYLIPLIQSIVVCVMFLLSAIIRGFFESKIDLEKIVDNVILDEYNYLLSIEPLRILAIVIIFISSLILIQLVMLLLMSGIGSPEENATAQTTVSIIMTMIYIVLMFMANDKFYLSNTARLMSFIPLLSPFIMCCRIAIKSAGIIDVAIGLTINILTLMFFFNWMIPIYQKNLFIGRK